jgi:hypothetical protein
MIEGRGRQSSKPGHRIEGRHGIDSFLRTPPPQLSTSHVHPFRCQGVVAHATAIQPPCEHPGAPPPCKCPGSTTEQGSEGSRGATREGRRRSKRTSSKKECCLPVGVDLLPWLAGGVDPGVDKGRKRRDVGLLMGRAATTCSASPFLFHFLSCSY